MKIKELKIKELKKSAVKSAVKTIAKKTRTAVSMRIFSIIIILTILIIISAGIMSTGILSYNKSTTPIGFAGLGEGATPINSGLCPATKTGQMQQPLQPGKICCKVEESTNGAVYTQFPATAGCPTFVTRPGISSTNGVQATYYCKRTSDTNYDALNLGTTTIYNADNTKYTSIEDSCASNTQVFHAICRDDLKVIKPKLPATSTIPADTLIMSTQNCPQGAICKNGACEFPPPTGTMFKCVRNENSNTGFDPEVKGTTTVTAYKPNGYDIDYRYTRTPLEDSCIDDKTVAQYNCDSNEGDKTKEPRTYQLKSQCTGLTDKCTNGICVRYSQSKPASEKEKIKECKPIDTTVVIATSNLKSVAKTAVYNKQGTCTGWPCCELVCTEDEQQNWYWETGDGKRAGACTQ